MIIKIGTLGTMKAEFVRLEPRKAHLIGTMEVSEGVSYNIVAALSYQEIWKIVKAALSPAVLWYIVSGWAKGKNQKPPKL